MRGLEVAVAAQLSGDKVLTQELVDGVDIHSANMERFNLPSRLIAKVFKFRLIYGGSAYSYANDIQFKDVSSSEQFWQEVINSYYEKYFGISAWHEKIVSEAKIKGRLEIPSGRYYPFSPEPSFQGFKWPITKIKNYPVN